ncbi:MAG: hypothetical protein CSB48_01875 [Proteobacteria bacterium]|nr:MAG: hypothetical protein CSB48_01875 [Pseudomonadota bacterium]PIE40389.1 MAG: hypothetical protein CSA51_00915 [Gammaproteobacteria bacterium]
MDEANKKKLQNELNANSHELFIMTAEEFAQFKSRIASVATLDNAKTIAGYVAPAMDAATVVGQVREFGAGGRIVEKTIGGRRYVILKGYPGLRKALKGTRYLANNPKIVSMAIGKVGVAKSILHGAKITVFLTVPINVLKYLIDEQSTLGSLIGTIASDLVKVGISSALAAGAAAAVGVLTKVAAGPLVAALFVGVATAILLEKIDAEFGLTTALINFIDETYQSLYDKTIGELARQLVRLENILNWQARNGVPVGKGIFY